MPSIDRWVARTSFAWLAACPDPTGFRLSINLSGTTLSDDQFLDFVGELFATHAVPPAASASRSPRRPRSPISPLRPLHPRAAPARLPVRPRRLRERPQLLRYLKNLPVDFLKIDGSFVRDLLSNPIDRAMVRAINEVGHAMGIRTIAEFVERQETLHVLAALGVDYAQGWASAGRGRWWSAIPARTRCGRPADVDPGPGFPVVPSARAPASIAPLLPVDRARGIP